MSWDGCHVSLLLCPVLGTLLVRRAEARLVVRAAYIGSILARATKRPNLGSLHAQAGAALAGAH